MRDKASEIVQKLMVIDSDERLNYIQKNYPNIQGSDLISLAKVREEFFNTDHREQIRAIARQCYASKESWHNIISLWWNEAITVEVVELLNSKSFPDSYVAIGYLICEANNIALAAYLIHLNRVENPLDPIIIEQSDEEIARDLRFTNF